MDARKELFAYLGTSIATVVGLFAVQLWYESYLDVSVVQAQLGDAAVEQKLAEVRAQEKAKLESGKKPIEQAMRELAERGRSAFPALATTPSDDVSPMSGWIHRHGFAAYEPRKPPPPPAAEVPAEGAAAPVDGAAAPADGKPAAEPAAPAAPAAAPKPGRLRVVGGTAPPAATDGSAPAANPTPTGR